MVAFVLERSQTVPRGTWQRTVDCLAAWGGGRAGRARGGGGRAPRRGEPVGHHPRCGRALGAPPARARLARKPGRSAGASRQIRLHAALGGVEPRVERRRGVGGGGHCLRQQARGYYPWVAPSRGGAGGNAATIARARTLRVCQWSDFSRSLAFIESLKCSRNCLAVTRHSAVSGWADGPMGALAVAS